MQNKICHEDFDGKMAKRNEGRRNNRETGASVKLAPRMAVSPAISENISAEV
jgi:hypothetical protein